MSEREKRSSIRVKSKVLLKVIKISPKEYQTKVENFSTGRETPETDTIRYPVLSYDIKPQLKKIREKEEALATVLDVLDQKLSFIIQKFRQEEEEEKGFTEVEADISAAGIAFVCRECMDAGQYLELQIGLMPDYFHFLALGRVVRATPLDDGKWCIGVEFTWITEDDRERLIEYLFQRQVMQLKMRRMKRESKEQRQ